LAATDQHTQQLSATQLLGCVFLPFGIGYLISDLLRTVNAVIAGRLSVELDVSAGELGFLSSLFFLAFALCQLPVGMLLDRFGPRRVESLLLLVAAAGCLLFASARGLTGAAIGRTLIGIGASACLMAGFKAFALWFPAHRLATLNGYLMAFGALGGVAATRPVEAFLQLSSWRALFVLVAIGTVAAALLLWVRVPERTASTVPVPFRAQLQELAAIFRDRRFLAAAPTTFLTLGLAMAILGLWAGPWLRDVAHFSTTEVAQTLLWMTLSYVASLAGWATLAGRLAARGVTPLRLAMLATLLLCIGTALFALAPVRFAGLLWPLYALAAGGTPLLYAGVTSTFPAALTGRVNAALNLLAFAGAFILQWLIGEVVGWWPTGDYGYAPRGYQLAFGVLAGIQLLALLWLAFGWPVTARHGEIGRAVCPAAE
jgi:MFS family permease